MINTKRNRYRLTAYDACDKIIGCIVAYADDEALLDEFYDTYSDCDIVKENINHEFVDTE